MDPDRIHVYPLDSGRKTTHFTDHTGYCWCEPAVRQVCSEADEEGVCQAGCWRCSGTGLVEFYDDNLNVLLIHSDYQKCVCGEPAIASYAEGQEIPKTWTCPRCGAVTEIDEVRLLDGRDA